MSNPNQQQTICYNGVCRVKGMGDDPFVYDSGGNVVGVATYGTLGSTAPPPTAGGTSGFGGSPTVYYPADPVPPPAVGVPSPPALVAITAPPTGYVRMDEGFFGSDGELYETGWLSPHQVTHRLPSGNNWSGLAEASATDTYMATVAGATTTQLLARDFRVNLPDNANVVDIDIEINGRILQGGPEDDAVKLIYCGAETIEGGGPPTLAGSYGPLSLSGTTTTSNITIVSTSTHLAFTSSDDKLNVFPIAGGPVDQVNLPGSYLNSTVFQLNDKIYVHLAGSGVYKYTPGTLTFIGALTESDFHTLAATYISGGQEKLLMFIEANPGNGPILSISESDVVSVSYFPLPAIPIYTDSAYYGSCNDQVIMISNSRTQAVKLDTSTMMYTNIAAPPSIPSNMKLHFSKQPPTGDYVAFLFMDPFTGPGTKYMVLQYDLVNDLWSTPVSSTDYEPNTFLGSQTLQSSKLSSGSLYTISFGNIYNFPWKYTVSGSTVVLTPIDNPTFDEGRVMQDGSTYTCYTETAKALGASDIALTPTTKVYTGPSIEQRFVNDSSFGVIYEPSLTSGNMVGIDSVRINVRYLSQPSASAPPPAMVDANGYTSVAFGKDGVEIIFGSAAGGLDYANINDPFATSPYAVNGGVGGRSIYDVVSTPNGHVAVGANGLVVVQDGIGGPLNVVKVGTTDAITSVVYELRTGSVVASTAGGATLVSQDGSNFVYIPSGLENDSYAMAVTPTAIVRVGANGSIYRSTDGGYTWTTIESPTTEDLFAIHYDSLNLVAVGANGTIIYSSDNGQTWVALTSGTANDLYTVIGESNIFVAAGEGGVMLTSQNGGYTWSPAASGTTSDIRGGAIEGGTYYLVGDESVILSGSLLSDMSMIPEEDACTMDDSFSVIVHYANQIDESARDHGGFPEVLIENMQEEYGALVPNVTAGVTAYSLAGENATLHEANFIAGPHVLESAYKTADGFSYTYGLLILIQEALEADDTATAAALAFLLTMAEQMSVSEDHIIGGTIVLDLSEGMAGDDTQSLIAALRATISEGLISGMLFGPRVGSPDPDDNPEDDVWDCWVVNTETRATTTYNNFFFTSMTEVDGTVYTTDGATIYTLGGDTDAGAIIPAEIELPISDFGDSHLKNVNRVYLGMWADGKMALKTITEGNVERWYELEARREGVHEYRVPLPKGVKSRYWAFQIGNVMGGDFSLESVTILPVVLSRRVR